VERVAFLIENTGERLGCLLNPESLAVSRLAGVRPRRSVGGPLTGARLSDDPLLYTGGGVTELKLDLLFDVSVSGSSIHSDDIRDLTGPLRDLAENTGSTNDDRQRRPPLATFIWGKAWNITGVVTAIAEKLESFTAVGVPRRSWLRLRFVRVDERASRRPRTHRTRPPLPEFLSRTGGIVDSALGEIQPDDIQVHEVIGGSNSGSGASERLEEIAQRHYGDASWWRVIAAASGILDPLNIPAGTRLSIPSLSLLNRWK
jgi:hypothetical protein